MLKEFVVIGGSLAATGLFVLLVVNMPWQFSAGGLLGLGLAQFAVRMLHGFWIGDSRYRRRGA